MTEIFPSVRTRLFAAVTTIAIASSSLAAQTPVTAPGPAITQPAAPIPLSLGDAARLAK